MVRRRTNAATAFSVASDEIYYQGGLLYIGVGGAPDAAVFNNAYPVGSVVTISETGVANTVFTVTNAASYNGIEIELPATLTSGSGNYGSNWVMTDGGVSQSGKYLTTDGTSASWATLVVPIVTGTATITGNTATTIDTIAIADFTSAEYMVSLRQGSKTRTSKVIVQDNGTDVDMTEFAITETGGTMTGVVVAASVSSTNAILQVTVTDASSTNVTVKFSKVAL